MDWPVIGVLVSMVGVNLTVLAIALRRNGNGRPVRRPDPHRNPLDLDHIRVGDITLSWLKEIMTEAVAAGIKKAKKAEEEARRAP